MIRNMQIIGQNKPVLVEVVKNINTIVKIARANNIHRCGKKLRECIDSHNSYLMMEPTCEGTVSRNHLNQLCYDVIKEEGLLSKR